jgi:hypothetical protein
MRHATSKAVSGSNVNRRRVSPLACLTGVALFAAITAANAQSTGVAACDDFLTKYDTCVSSKLPEAQRATYKAQLDQTRKTWVEMAKNPSAKATMEASCKQTMDAMKASLQSFGCSF